MRGLPSHLVLADPPPGYARLATWGWDTVQEAWCFTPNAAFMGMMERAQAEARSRDETYEGEAQVALNGIPHRVPAFGAKGFKFRAETDDYILLIGPPARDWSLTVRFLAAGLWEHGYEGLRARVLAALRGYGTFDHDADHYRVSRADWAFDFHSPAFTQEAKPGLSNQVLCHSSTHAAERMAAYVSGAVLQTLDIGSKGGLQVSIYDKSQEIKDRSGKVWFYELWARNLDGELVEADVWRLELRFSSDHLKARNIRTPAKLVDALRELIVEALVTRRLTVPSDDMNRARWPVHPLWVMAIRASGATQMLPLGRIVTGERDEFREKMVRQIAGTIRSATVAASRDYRHADASQLAQDALSHVLADPQHKAKISDAKARYMFQGEAKL